MSNAHVSLLKAVAIVEVEDGPAFWRVRAASQNGSDFFTKIPHLDPTGGHDGPWKEYIATMLATAVGLPTLGPNVISVGPGIVETERRKQLYWGRGEQFFCTPWSLLTPCLDYSSLGPDGVAMLYVYDNYIHYFDRARPGHSRADCQLTDRGPIVLDWDLVPLSTDPTDEMNPENYSWEASRFLANGMGNPAVREACEALVGNLSNVVISDIVAKAAIAWGFLAAPVLERWLCARRDAILGAFEDANKGTPPWWVFNSPNS